MASAVELVWQWAYLIAILLIVMILLCCFGGCWGSFAANVRGFCSDGISCGFAPFRKKRKKVAVLTTDGPPPQGDVIVRTSDGRKIVMAEQEEIDPWGTLCGGVLSVITLCYCCGALKPDGEDKEESEQMIPKKAVVAQPVTIVAPAPAKQPSALVVKAEPVVLPALNPPAPVEVVPGTTGSRIPLLPL
jgi:hypothetical protein